MGVLAIGLVGVEAAAACGIDADCPTGAWCRVGACVPFAPEGGRCGGYVTPDAFERCAPGAICAPEMREPIVADAPGRCRSDILFVCAARRPVEGVVSVEGGGFRDPFGPVRLRVRSARRRCAPAALDGAGTPVTDQDGGLWGVDVRPEARARIVRDVRVDGPFGELTVDLARPVQLLVSGDDGGAGGLRLCRRTRRSRLRRVARASVITAEGEPVTFRPTRPRWLCSPAAVEGSPLPATSSLVCLGSRASAEAGRRLVCLPALPARP